MNLYDASFTSVLTEFITDFAENKLDTTELVVFSEYLNQNPAQRERAVKAAKGREMLQSLPEHKVAADFEEKLARRIAKERAEMLVAEEQ
jgi:anti-sigma factor RsiW